MFRRSICITAWAASVPAAGALGQQQYTVTSLGGLGGPTYAFAIGAHGEVVGYSARPGDNAFRAVAWDGAVHDLGTPAGRTQSAAFASGPQLAYGVAYSLGATVLDGFSTDGVSMVDIAEFAPRGVNSAGALVGDLTYQLGALFVHHAGMSINGVRTDLGTLGGQFSSAFAVNSAGFVAGSAYDAQGRNRPCVWVGGAAHDLGTLGGASGQAMAINDAGRIAGYAQVPSGRAHAVLYTIDGVGGVVSTTDLGALGDGWSYGYGINAQGDVVGTSRSHAFLWRGGTLTDLNTLIPPSSGWRLEVASDIDDSGKIAGWGVLNGMGPAAFLLSPATCAADWNGVDGLDSQDFFDFLEAFFAGDADFNGVDGTDSQDYFDFIEAFIAGC